MSSFIAPQATTVAAFRVAGIAVRTTNAAEAVRNNQPANPQPLQRIDKALAKAGEKLLDLRQQRIIAVYDLDEVMHFYSFYHALREAAREARDELARLT